MNAIYLDHNSTTPIAPEVAAAIAECHAAGYVNPASQHAAGRQARRRLEAAREGIAQILGAKTTGMDADSVIFTSGGTEANNLAVSGLASKQSGTLIISGIEHPSVVGPAEALARRGWNLQRLRVSHEGVVDLQHLAELVADIRQAAAASGALLSVMLGNNETGVLQPVREIATLCRAASIPVHTDGVQVAGKLRIDFRGLGVDAMTVSAHKFHGPRGIGVLVVRSGVALQPLLHGGFQQAGLRPGTEDVALAVGMHTALRQWRDEADERRTRMQVLRDSFEQQLRDGDSSIVINGEGADRLPHTSNISLPGINRQALLMALDMVQVACSTGSACASGSSEPSPVLLAMGCAEAVVAGSLRFSLGATTTTAEIAEAARRILHVVKELRREKNTEFGGDTPRESA